MDCLGHVLFFFFFEQINGKKKNSLVIKMVSDDKLLIMDMDMNINECRYMNINLSLDFSLSNLSYLCLKKYIKKTQFLLLDLTGSHVNVLSFLFWLYTI